MKLDLGCGDKKLDGYVGVDVRPGKGVDVVADLSKKWPFEDASVDHVRAIHSFEHLPDSLHTMAELYRVLKPGAEAQIEVPSTNGMGAFQDPGHKSFWNMNTFAYFNREHDLGEMYDSNKFEVAGVNETNSHGIVWWGPTVRAIVRKPKVEEGEGQHGGNGRT